MQGFSGSWEEHVARVLASKGFKVSTVVEKFRALDGSIVERSKLVAFKGERVKVSVVSSGGCVSLMILFGGDYAESDEIISTVEAFGGTVELDEDKGRLLIIFKSVDAEKVGAIVGQLL